VTELHFPRVDQPTVSIVIATHGARKWVEETLRLLSERTPPCYEVILVDNASKDGTTELLRDSVAGARVAFNPRNLGFGTACNQGAAMAHGRHLLFLNSDLLVQDRWLEPLLETLEDDDRVAAVGPRLLSLDGTLQCAGALLGRSGAALAYGFGLAADAPEGAFRRDVDYLSGSCLLVRRERFHRVGGFDAGYGLAYHEDADLCLSLNGVGDRVVYEPASTVIHVRGASGQELDVMPLAVANRGRFEQRWRKVLRARPYSPLKTPRRTLAARDAPAQFCALVLDEPDGARLAREMAMLWPRSRVTLAANEPPPSLAGQGVELIRRADEPDSWLATRRFQYDVVITAQAADVLRTQPQATLIEPATVGTRSTLVEAMVAAGIAPPVF
jgi:GT2 family glycosyltransferase